MTDTAVVVDFTALLLGVLGHTDSEFTALGYEDTAGNFHTAVMAPADAPGVVDQIPPNANIFSASTRSQAHRGATPGAEEKPTSPA